MQTKPHLALLFCPLRDRQRQGYVANCGSILVPIGQISLYVTYALKMDDTIGTSLPKEVRIAIRNHKTLFYQAGLLLNVTSSISMPPVALF